MREEMSSNIESPSLFSFDPVSNFWQIGALRAKKGLVDAWDIPLAEVMRRLRKLSVVPPVNLVRNVGFSKLASNTKTQNYPLDLPIERLSDGISLDNLLLHNSISGSKIDFLYENRVYGIALKNALTVLISQLDFIRFKKYSTKNLKNRLDNVRDANFRIL